MDKLPWLGASVKRKEDERLLRGSGRFTDDVEVPRTLHVAVGRCPFPHARITRIDVDAARELEGVRPSRSAATSRAHGADHRAAARPGVGAHRATTRWRTDVARYEGQPVVASRPPTGTWPRTRSS